LGSAGGIIWGNSIAFPQSRRTLVLTILCTLLFAAASHAAEPAKEPGPPAPTKGEEKPKVFTHQFAGTFHGDHVTYTATAGETFLKNEKLENTASIFSVAYVKSGVTNAAQRPVTFVFNGGPGSASLWLHIGALGPKRVALPSDATSAGAAPYRIEDNPLSPLDATDLVFIDPVGTGYSHAMGEAKDEDFWGLSEDAKSISQFIRIWLTASGRWNSPKYIAGESYGTTRAVALMRELQPGYDGVYLKGIILVSSVLDFHTIGFQPGNDLPYIAYLPSYAAVAWYHDKIAPKPASLSDFLNEVRAFASTDYALALLKGSALAKADRAAIVGRLSHYTGLSPQYIEEANLRIDASRFRKELLRSDGKILGRYDGRAVGEDYDSAGEGPESDPSLSAVDGAFVAAINEYLSRTLGVQSDRPYKILETAPNQKWKWGEGKGMPSYINVAPDLGQAMRENSAMRTFIANGYFDLATPFAATEFTVAHNAIAADRVAMHYYDAGHMLYTNGSSLERFTDDVVAFIKSQQ
jgi:carboxypeptidase C (cathepsin A)